ncbi:Transducin/WD40 repeat-like superfamily protein [Arabidopsis thaliana]|uniref:Transducin/WD40 repeat-like superfamily protein n=1 Tax=Arabidopsis thaliana TaxID=3702 RepID=F4I1K5_ARATH|nr:Transducin/WD40 repeat-like superfamily protein [Arabidopsis thaliana]AEE31844.1 Transducin/WD40 repeat-like superfamily protein [Arabidopsis thaliana]|eukprot:NP_001185142.1 Transducin/WD40 repeat-like superfamily protein [Arabidopsis thaliana]
MEQTKDDSDFEDDCETKMETDTSAQEARNGKDIQGIQWEGFKYNRDEFRETRLKQYDNFVNILRPSSREKLDKEHGQVVEKGKNFYDFQFNTRLVTSTIVHFQLRNLVWATSKHDVYLMQNYSLMHWSSLLQRGKEVLNVARSVTPTQKLPGLFSEPLSRVQVSSMAVKENLILLGGFDGELLCKCVNQPGVAFCTRLSTEDNAITNTVDIYRDPSGSLRLITANNDCKIRVFDAQSFTRVSEFALDWSVNNTSVSPDGKLLAVVGDSTECLISDSHSGKVISSLRGHKDYSFASAWHPNGLILATGNQDTACRLWDIRNPSESFAVLKGNMGAIRGLKFTPEGRFLAMAEPADFVHIFDTQSGFLQSQEIDLFGEIAGISFSPDTEALYVGVADRTYGSLLEYKRRKDNHYMDSFY